MNEPSKNDDPPDRSQAPMGKRNGWKLSSTNGWQLFIRSAGFVA